MRRGMARASKAGARQGHHTPAASAPASSSSSPCPGAPQQHAQALTPPSAPLPLTLPQAQAQPEAQGAWVRRLVLGARKMDNPSSPTPPSSSSTCLLHFHVMPLLLLLLAAAADVTTGLTFRTDDISSESLAYRAEFKAREAAPSEPSSFLEASSQVEAASLQQGSSLQPSSGPCQGASVELDASSESDLYMRTTYSPSTPVIIRLRGDIRLSQPLVLDDTFSCTRFFGPSGGATLIYFKSDAPTLSIFNTSNVWLWNVGIRHGANAQSLPCAFSYFEADKLTDTLTCPGVYISCSYSIQLTEASILGRIDVFRSVDIVLDHLQASLPYRVYDTAHPYEDERTHGVINIAKAGTGSGFARSFIKVTNCEVWGAWELVSLILGATGVSVSNNYLHDFQFAAVRCGNGSAYVMDCHHNVISNNFIFNPPLPSAGLTRPYKNSGIYIETKWFNPGLYVSCNFISNPRFGYYLALDSSGVVVDGGNCNNVTVAVWIDNGKFNQVTGLVSNNTRAPPSSISCSTLTTVNCFGGAGNNWEALRRKYYNSPFINRVLPYMASICNPVPSTVNNVVCNPPSQVQATVLETGYCSGLPYNNDIEIFSDNLPTAFRPSQSYSSCQALTANLALLNNQTWVNTTDPSKPKASPECPWARVGPLPVAIRTYTSFNKSAPSYFEDVVGFDLDAIYDPTLSVPTSAIQVA